MAKVKGNVANHEEYDDEMEALIRKELDALGEKDLEVDTASDLDSEGKVTRESDEFERSEVDIYEQSISNYLQFIKQNDEKVLRNITESKQLLVESKKGECDEQNAVFAKKLKLLLEDEGEDVNSEDLLQLRIKTIAEFENGETTQESETANLTVALVQPVEEIVKLEEEQSAKLKDLLRKQEEERRAEEEALNEAKENMAREEIEEEAKKRERLKELEIALKVSEKTEMELSKPSGEQAIKEIEQELEEKIKEIDMERAKEEEEYFSLKANLELERAKKRMEAIVIIQKICRGYWVRKKYGTKLIQLKRARKQMEQERLEEMEKIEEQRKLEKLEQTRLEKEKMEKKRLEKERLEKERLEKERLEKERLEKERLEEKRIEIERVEKERLEKERLEKERLEKERLEKERLEKERLEKERLEEKRIEIERVEKERLEKERLEKERLEKERLEKERLEKERLEEKRIENERVLNERLEKESLEKERLEKERLEKKMLEKERLEKERLEKERLEKERLEIRRLEKEKENLKERLTKEKLGVEKIQNEALEKRASQKENVKKMEEKISNFCNEESTEMKLPERLEKMRQKWKRNHPKYRRPAKMDHSKHQGKSRLRARLKKSLEPLQEIDATLVSKSFPKDITQHTCQCITLRDLDGIRLKGIERFPNVKIVSLTRCGLEAVECLETCVCLEKLFLPLNNIDTLIISFNATLREVSLRGNNLSSTIGLEQLINLEVLDLSSNRIARIGQISACKRLRWLDLSENQLLSIKGVEDLKSLTNLKVSNNHLGNAKEVERLPLLTSLDLQSNSINMLMAFMDHVLLREINLHENDIVDLSPISEAWLPLLEMINVAGNSIEVIPSLNHLAMLKSIDVRDNLIKSTPNLLAGIGECKCVVVLKVLGNPVNNIPAIRGTIKKALPSLLHLDDFRFENKPKECQTVSDFEKMCMNQIQGMKEKRDSNSEKIATLRSAEDRYFCELQALELERQHRGEIFSLLLRHIKEHENFGLHGTEAESSGSESSGDDFALHRPTKHVEANDKAVAHGDRLEKVSHDVTDSQLTLENSRTTDAEEREMGKEVLEDKAAIESAKVFMADEMEKAGKMEKVDEMEKTETWEKAAIIIQASYRGYRVRRIRSTALEKARQDDQKPGGDCEDDDFDYDEEVDLTAFDFDDNCHDWRPGDAPQLPSRTSTFPPTEPFGTAKPRSDSSEPPKYAWQSCPRTPEQSFSGPVERLGLEISPDPTDRSSTIAETVTSKKKDEIISEWGFQNVATADLMMKRAKKMNKAARRKNLLGLAANKRYELFKKLQESKPSMTVRPPTKNKATSRIEYFSAQKERDSQSSLSNLSTDKDFKNEMTYSWVCNQAVLHYDAYNDIIGEQQRQLPQQQQESCQATSHRGEWSNRPERVSLPYLDPAIIAGKSLPLVIASRVASNPALASNRNSTKGLREGDEKSRSAPNPSKRSAPVFTGNDSSSSRSSSSDTRRRTKK